MPELGTDKPLTELLAASSPHLMSIYQPLLASLALVLLLCLRGREIALYYGYPFKAPFAIRLALIMPTTCSPLGRPYSITNTYHPTTAWDLTHSVNADRMGQVPGSGGMVGSCYGVGTPQR